MVNYCLAIKDNKKFAVVVSELLTLEIDYAPIDFLQSFYDFKQPSVQERTFKWFLEYFYTVETLIAELIKWKEDSVIRHHLINNTEKLIDIFAFLNTADEGLEFLKTNDFFRTKIQSMIDYYNAVDQHNENVQKPKCLENINETQEQLLLDILSKLQPCPEKNIKGAEKNEYEQGVSITTATTSTTSHNSGKNYADLINFFNTYANPPFFSRIHCHPELIGFAKTMIKFLQNNCQDISYDDCIAAITQELSKKNYKFDPNGKIQKRILNVLEIQLNDTHNMGEFKIA